MADKTARNGVILIGASAAALGYFLWKSRQGSRAAQTPTTAAAPKEAAKNTEKNPTMTHVLHLDSSARGSSSHSRTVSAELVEAMKAADPGVTVTYRDLGHEAVPYVTETFIYAMYTPAEQRSAEMNVEIALSDQLVAELAAADVYVLGVPMYNFTVPGVFKSYIDQVVRPGVTFDPATYTGLLLNKKMVVVTARGGGGYGAGEAREAYNVQDPVIKNAFGLMGVTDVEFIHVNNTARGEDVVNGALAEAREKIAALAPTLTK